MGENRKIYAALLGAGTVGSGVYKLAGMQEEDICLKTGAQLEIKKILVRNPGKVREGIPQELFTDSWQEILEDPEIQIVIEVMGGIEPARTYVEEAMKAGKQVVTANKDLLAEYGDPLFEIATEMVQTGLSRGFFYKNPEVRSRLDAAVQLPSVSCRRIWSGSKDSKNDNTEVLQMEIMEYKVRNRSLSQENEELRGQIEELKVQVEKLKGRIKKKELSMLKKL